MDETRCGPLSASAVPLTAPANTIATLRRIHRDPELEVTISGAIRMGKPQEHIHTTANMGAG
jgi:hypothetical protein